MGNRNKLADPLPGPSPSSKLAPSMSIPHYAWAAGHGLVLLTSLYALLGVVTFKPHPYSYKLAYSGAVVSWGIVVYKSLGIPSLNMAYVRRALLDENVQYLLLALYWMTAEKPIPLTLVPFATFSLFHTLTFVRSLLPKAAAAANGAKKGDKPSAAADKKAAPAAGGPAAQLNKTLQTWIKKNYESAMLFVSYFEVIVIMGRVTLGAISFRNSLFTPLVFAHFLRLRYYLSPQTRQAFGYVSGQVDNAIAHPSVPDPVKKGLTIARDLVKRYSSSILQGQPTGAAPAAGAGAGAGAGAARAGPAAAQ